MHIFIQSLISFFVNYKKSVLWAIFSVMFFVMAIRYYLKSHNGLDSLKAAYNNHHDGTITHISLGGVNFEDLSRDLDKEIKDFCKITAVSYFLAGITSLLSLMLSF